MGECGSIGSSMNHRVHGVLNGAEESEQGSNPVARGPRELTEIAGKSPLKYMGLKSLTHFTWIEHV